MRLSRANRFLFMGLLLCAVLSVHAAEDSPKRQESDDSTRDDRTEFVRIPPKEPADAVAFFETLDGFQMQLVAHEPNVMEPIAITYDENGLLYVAEYLKFPTMGGKSDRPDGRIRLLRDRDGDGLYEQSHVFADGLAWPTGICAWKGGVFVIASPDLW